MSQLRGKEKFHVRESGLQYRERKIPNGVREWYADCRKKGATGTLPYPAYRAPRDTCRPPTCLTRVAVPPRLGPLGVSLN